MHIRSAATMLALALLPGCGSDEVPAPTLPPLTATPPPTASALPTPPPEAEPATPEGAAAFARFYLETVTASLAEADPEPLASLSDEGCEGCNNLIALAEELRDSGQRIRGGEYNVAVAEAPAPEVPGDYIVTLRYELAASATLDASGAELATEAAAPPTDAIMRVVREADQWSVFGFQAQEN